MNTGVIKSAIFHYTSNTHFPPRRVNPSRFDCARKCIRGGVTGVLRPDVRLRFETPHDGVRLIRQEMGGLITCRVS